MSWGGEAARWSLKFSGGEADTNLIVMIVRYSNLTPKWIIFVSKTLYNMNQIGSKGITPQFPFLAYPIYCGYHAWCFLPELFMWPHTVLRPFWAVPVTTHCVMSFQSSPSYHTLCYVLSELSQLPHTMLCPFRAVPVTTHCAAAFQSYPCYHTLLFPFRATPVITPCYFLSELSLLSHPVISFQSYPCYYTLLFPFRATPFINHTLSFPFRATPVISFQSYPS